MIVLGFVFPGSVGSWSIQVQGLLIIAFILLSAVLALLRFRVTQNIVNVVFVLYGLGIALMLLALMPLAATSLFPPVPVRARPSLSGSPWPAIFSARPSASPFR